MRSVALTTSKGGITRLRTKGAALNDSLYDLVNGYITAARTIKSRPGTRRLYDLPPGTVGLVTFGGRLHVFASEPKVGMPDDVTLVVLLSPDASEGDPREIVAIHFAEPFLGYLYVVAEFDDGNVYHYWLEAAEAWQPNTAYRHGDLVMPTAGDTGVVYRARRASSPYPAWQPNIARTVGDRIEPTVYNDFFYEAVATTGSNPRSGTTEPNWPTTDGAQITESPDFAVAPITGGGPPSGGDPPPDGPGRETDDRYGRLPGGTRDVERF